MAYTVKLLITGALMAFLQGLYCNNEMYDYKVYRDNLTYTEADHSCQGQGRRLAQIDNVSKLNYLQSKSSRYKGEKFWMGLKVEGKWEWSTGVKPKHSPGFLKIVNYSAQEISINKDGVYCFLVTNDDRLQMENCTLKHPYICGLYTGLLTTQSLPTATSVSSDAAAPIKSTLTNTVIFTSQGTYIATGKTILTATAEIMPTRTFIMISHVTSISPTSFVSPETQIKEYFSKIHKLSVVDEDSLQIAVNETSVLLTRLHDTSYHKTVPNVLPAAQQLEKFAAEYATIHLNTNGTSNSTKTYKGKNFEMMVRKINVGHKKDVIVPSDGKLLLSNTKDKIILPAELFKTKETVVVGIVYKDIHLLLPDESQACLDGKKLENAKLQTRVIACYVKPRPLVVLEKNVTIIFTLNQPSKAEDRPYCVFWNFHEKSRFNGSWSSKGCSLVNSTDAKVVCTCNHLTNFAVLMQIGDTKIPAKHQVALEFITYIGCGLSLFGEVLTVIVYLVFMNFKQEQCQIRLNLVISIAVAQIIFLAGIDATARQGACIFVAVSIHYFYLAGFAWMLIEGIYLYLMVVKVFNTLVKMKLFYAVSWGFPCIMVLLSLVIASGTDDGITSYVHSDFCWVSFSNNLVWTFAVPVLLVSLINSVILCRVVCELTKMQGAKDISNIKQGLKACVVLFPLLGMTWAFGVLSVTDAGLVFQYIFTILNSLQGFFIFVMHVLRSSEVRAAYLRKKEKWNTTKNSNFPSSRSAIDASADFSEKHAMRPIRGCTESTDPLSRRHQVSPMNSDIMNTRESCLTPVDS